MVPSRFLSSGAHSLHAHTMCAHIQVCSAFSAFGVSWCVSWRRFASGERGASFWCRCSLTARAACASSGCSASTRTLCAAGELTAPRWVVVVPGCVGRAPCCWLHLWLAAPAACLRPSGRACCSRCRRASRAHAACAADFCCVAARLPSRLRVLMTSVDAQALHGVFPSDIVSWRDVSACSLSS